jgi:hypothetical protein
MGVDSRVAGEDRYSVVESKPDMGTAGTREDAVDSMEHGGTLLEGECIRKAGEDKLVEVVVN